MCVCALSEFIWETASVLYTWSVRLCWSGPHLQAGLNIKTEWWPNMHILIQPLCGGKKWHMTDYSTQQKFTLKRIHHDLNQLDYKNLPDLNGCALQKKGRINTHLITHEHMQRKIHTDGGARDNMLLLACCTSVNKTWTC